MCLLIIKVINIKILLIISKKNNIFMLITLQLSIASGAHKLEI